MRQSSISSNIFYDDDTPTEWGKRLAKINRYVVGTVLLGDVAWAAV